MNCLEKFCFIPYIEQIMFYCKILFWLTTSSFLLSVCGWLLQHSSTFCVSFSFSVPCKVFSYWLVLGTALMPLAKNTSLKMFIMNLQWWGNCRCLWKYNLRIVVLVDQGDVSPCLPYLWIVINPVTNLCLIPSCPSVMLLVHLFWALIFTSQNDTSNDQPHFEGTVPCCDGIKCQDVLGK